MKREALRVTSTIPVAPTTLYFAWIDSDHHSSMTGGSAKIDPTVGAKYSTLDSYVTGKLVILDLGRRIVMSWRTNDFPRDAADSRVEVHFETLGASTRILILHTEIPEGQSEKYKALWNEKYIGPMRSYFSKFLPDPRNPPAPRPPPPPPEPGDEGEDEDKNEPLAARLKARFAEKKAAAKAASASAKSPPPKAAPPPTPPTPPAPPAAPAPPAPKKSVLVPPPAKPSGPGVHKADKQAEKPAKKAAPPPPAKKAAAPAKTKKKAALAKKAAPAKKKAAAPAKTKKKAPAPVKKKAATKPKAAAKPKKKAAPAKKK